MYQLNLAILELTKACNLNCIHCIANATKKPDENELSTIEFLLLVEELAKLNCKNVVLSGGEPFLRSDWVIIAQKIKDLDMTLSIISNSYAVDDTLIELLSNVRPSAIGFSLDGGTAEMHDFIRGQKGAFNHLFNVADKLLQEDIYVSIASTINKKNYHELDLMLELLIKHNIKAWQIQIVKPTERLPENLLLSEEEYYSLAEKIVEYRQNYSDKIRIVEADCIGYYSKLTPFLEMKYWIGCQCGVQSISITSTGGVKGCPTMSQIEANIRDVSLSEIWHDNTKFAYNRRFVPEMLKGYCKECKYGNLCRGGCSQNPINNTGSPYCLHKIETIGY